MRIAHKDVYVVLRRCICPFEDNPCVKQFMIYIVQMAVWEERSVFICELQVQTEAGKRKLQTACLLSNFYDF